LPQTLPRLALTQSKGTEPQLTRIDPADARIAHQRRHAAVDGVKEADLVLLHVARIDEAIRIRLEPIADAPLAMVPHRALRKQLAALAALPQLRRRDTIQPAATNRAKVQILAISRQRNAVAAQRDRRQRLVRARNVVQRVAPDVGHEAALSAHLGDVVEVAPGVARAQVDDDDAVAALGARVGNVRYAFACRRQRGTQVEAHVVEVRVWECDRGWEDHRLRYGVGCEVDGYQLGPAVTGEQERAVFGLHAACVEDPEAVERVEDDALHANEVVLVVC
jgi:hypothetical protein